MIRKYRDYRIYTEDLAIVSLRNSRMTSCKGGPRKENLAQLREDYLDLLKRAPSLGDRRTAKVFRKASAKPGCRMKDIRRLTRKVRRSSRRLRRIWGKNGPVIDTLVIMQS